MVSCVGIFVSTPDQRKKFQARFRRVGRPACDTNSRTVQSGCLRIAVPAERHRRATEWGAVQPAALAAPKAAGTNLPSPAPAADNALRNPPTPFVTTPGPASLVGIFQTNVDAAENNFGRWQIIETCTSEKTSSRMTPRLRSFAFWVVESNQSFRPAKAQQIFTSQSRETGESSQLFDSPPWTGG